MFCRIRIVLVVPLLFAAAIVPAWAGKVGREFRINSYTESHQTRPSTAALNDGGFVVVWESNGQDGSANGIYGQRYDSDGKRRRREFQVNTFTAGLQHLPSVAPLDDGGFVVVWASFGQDRPRRGIYGQRYDADSRPVGKEFRVTRVAGEDEDLLIRTKPFVAGLSGGGFIVIWHQLGDVGDYKLYGQRFDADRRRAGAEFLISAFDVVNGTVGGLDDGGFVVVWTVLSGDVVFGIAGRRYAADGTLLDTFWVLDVGYSSETPPEAVVSRLIGGGFVVVWQRRPEGHPDWDIHGRRYKANATPAGNQFQVNRFTAGNQTKSVVSGLSDGGFVALWQSQGQDGSGTGIYGQRYGADGRRAGREFRVNRTVAGNQTMPSVAGLHEGGFVAAWESPDTSGSGIYGQRFDGE